MAIYLNGQLIAGGNMITNNLVFLKDNDPPTVEDLNQYNSDTLIVYTGEDEAYFYICWEFNNRKHWYKVNIDIESMGGVQ